MNLEQIKATIKSEEYDFLRKDKNLGNNIIILTLGGSHAYGTNNENSDLDMLDLGYACTVHKSQGSEFKSVIINLQCAHSVMLVRPLIYTAITRAKEKVMIVGERRALCTAIRRVDTEQRGTKLAQRINDFCK